MRIEELEGQESLFAHDSGSGKTSSGRSAAGEILQQVKNSLGQAFLNLIRTIHIHTIECETAAYESL